jgi:hypothetical protein
VTPASAATRWIAALALTVSLAGAACGGPETPEGTAGKAIRPISPDPVPAQLLDLDVAPEDVSATLGRTTRTYVSNASLYSMRKDDLVHATLQVLRFNRVADAGDPKFRALLVSQLGGTATDQANVGEDTVHFTRGIRQRISVWYRDDHMLVLSVRDDYDKPRSLLRAALGIRP